MSDLAKSPSPTIEKLTTKEKKELALSLMNQGKSVSEINRLTGISRVSLTNWKRDLATGGVQQMMHDNRVGQNLTIARANADIMALIVKMRLEERDGPDMIRAKLLRQIRSGKLNLDAKQVPSVDTIARVFKEQGLSKTPLGPKDKRGYPSDYGTEPGEITIDGWGPWHGASATIYAVTVHDRNTRLTYQLPTLYQSDHHYIHAVRKGIWHLLGGVKPHSITTDNGVGMQVSEHWTRQPVRHMLSLAQRVIFIPPAQPWRNGRLENIHWTIEREYWQRKQPHTVDECFDGLLKYLEYYNTDRPHSSLELRAPADTATWYTPQDRAGCTVPQYEPLDPQPGVMDVIRLCHSNGRIDLWGSDFLYVSDMFAGQFLRVRFYLDPDSPQQTGEVIWQQGKNKAPVTIATFNHGVDRTHKREDNLVTDIQLHNFDRFEEEFTLKHYGVDEEREAARVARVAKRPKMKSR